MYRFLPKIILILTLIFSAFSPALAQLSGTYNVGKSSTADYNSFSEAIDSLVAQGVNGAVVFKIDSGTYQEQVRIPIINGVSKSNSITFESAQATPAVFSYDSQTNTSNYIIQLDSTGYIHFRNIDFITHSSTYGHLIEIKGQSHNNSFSNCRFTGKATQSTNNAMALVFSITGDDPYHSFDSCTFKNGSYGLYLSGNDNEKYNRITNCKFSGQYWRNAFLSVQSDLLFENNILIGNSSITSGYFSSLVLSAVKKNVKIIANKLQSDAYGFVLLIEGSAADSLNPILVANNFISSSNETTSLGIFIESSRYINIYNNNINLSAHSKSTGTLRAFNIQTSSGPSSHLRIVNNIIQNLGTNNSGTAYGIISWQSDTFFFDYNCFYIPNGYLGYVINKGLATNISTWQNITDNSTHSFILDPKFYSAKDLHVGNSSLDSTALPISVVTTDIDGQKRNSTAPDIGADEFEIMNYDLAVISMDAPLRACAGDSVNLILTIRNQGFKDIDSFVINWGSDSSYTNQKVFYKKIGKAKEVQVTLARFYFNKSKSAYSFVFKVSNPNGQTDQNSNNDSILKSFGIGVSGYYSISKTNGDFSSISEATTYLTNYGLCGPVVFEIDSGVYNEQFSIPEIPGASVGNNITFTSKLRDKKSVTIRMSGTQWTNNHVASISGSYIRFEHISFENQAGDYGTNIRLSGKASHITFSNCSFKTVQNNLYSTNMALVYLGYNADSNNHIVFDSSEFNYGSYGMYIYGSYYLRDPGISVTHCRFIKQNNIGIYTVYQQAPIFNSNYFTTNDSSASTYTAISIAYADSGYSIQQNRIHLHGGGTGIQGYACYGNTTHPALIANNEIVIGGSSANARGMYIYLTRFINIYFNSIAIYNTANSSSAIRLGTSNTSLTVYNNIFSNFSNGYAFYVDNTSGTTINFNNYYSAGSMLVHWNKDYANFNTWRKNENVEKYGRSTNPGFKSKYELYPTALLLNNRAYRSTGVTNDILGKLRSKQAPDIGAYEFDINDYDAAIRSSDLMIQGQCDGKASIEVQIRNHGTVRLDSVWVDWKFNNQPMQSTMVYPGVSYLDDYTATVGYAYANSDSVYSLSAKTRLPNNKTDQDHSNDSFYLSKIKLIAAPQTPLLVPDSVCSGKQAILSGSSKNALFYAWYDSINSGKLLGRDSTYLTDMLTQSNTYYFEASSALKPDSFFTTINIVNPVDDRSNGIMMDIIAKGKDLYIDSFDIHTESTGNEIAWIYYKTNSFKGYEGKKSAWQFADSVRFTGQGFQKLTRLSLSKSIKIKKGDTVSIYIYTSYFNYFYSNLSPFSNNDLLIDRAIAMDANFDNFVTINVNFSGQIYYSNTPYCKTGRYPVTAVVNRLPDLPILKDTTFCSGNRIKVDAFDGKEFNYEWTRMPSNTIISHQSSIEIDTFGYFSIRAYNACGQSDSATFFADMKPKPKAGFTVNKTEQCLNQNKYIFTNKSSVSSGIMNFKWFFGDSDSSSNTSPIHSFGSYGTYPVNLRVESDYGCRDTHNIQVEVFANPKANISLLSDSTQCLNANRFKFIDASSIPVGTYTRQWFMDMQALGYDSSQINLHFAKTGKHTLSIIATSDHQCMDSSKLTLFVKANPVIHLGPDTSICIDSTISFKVDSSYDSYLWFNNENQSEIQLSYGNEQTVIVWVKVSSDGCEGSDSLNLKIVDCSNSIEPGSHNSSLVLYPNPATNSIRIRFKNDGESSLEIANASGQIVRKIPGIQSDESIDISYLAKGLYVIKISSQQKVYKSYFIKQ